LFNIKIPHLPRDLISFFWRNYRNHGPFRYFRQFRPIAYRRRIQSLGEQVIWKHEIQKRRQLHGAGFKMAGGGALAPFTMGISLVGTALGGRQYSIAEQKLAVIQQIMKEKAGSFTRKRNAMYLYLSHRHLLAWLREEL
jgi:hypothetical protein